MKWTHNNNVKYNGSPKSWFDTDLSIEETINKFYMKYLYAYDFDTCGDESWIFSFEDGTILKYHHSWYWGEDEEGEYSPINEWTPIDKDAEHFYENEYNKLDVPNWMKKYRDWI